MFGLIKKELYFLKDSLMILIASMIVIGIGASFVVSSEIFVIIFPILISSVVLTTISKDRNAKWDKFVATMSLSKYSLIKSKYIIYVMTVLVGIVIGIIAMLVGSYVRNGFSATTLFISIGIGLTVSCVSGGISIPISFIWSEEKALMAQIMSYALVAFTLTGGMYVINNFISVKDNITLIMGIMVGFSLLFFVLSWFYSKKKSLDMEFD